MVERLVQVIGGISVNYMEQAKKEYNKVIQWVLNEEDKVVEKLKKKGYIK